jgi:hypothetical protein
MHVDAHPGGRRPVAQPPLFPVELREIEPQPAAIGGNGSPQVSSLAQVRQVLGEKAFSRS